MVDGLLDLGTVTRRVGAERRVGQRPFVQRLVEGAAIEAQSRAHHGRRARLHIEIQGAAWTGLDGAQNGAAAAVAERFPL